MISEVNITAAGRQLTLCGTKETYLEGLKGWNADGGPISVATKDLPHGSLCFDVGANIGATAVTLAAQRPDVHIIAFEPIPENAECLRRNVHNNALENIEVIEVAVSDRHGYLPMAANGPWSAVTPGSELKIRSLPLDDFIDQPVAFIKIDTEGYEPNVFAGARELFVKSKPIVLVEFNSWCMLMHSYNPIVFSRALWSCFDILGIYHLDALSSVPVEDIGIAYENILHHDCVSDVLMRPRSRLPELDALVYGPEVAALRREVETLRNR